MKLLGPRILLHGEGLAVLICCCVLYGYWDYGWMWFALLFFAPDLSMLGYLWKLRVGAACYNAIHTYLAPLGLYLVLYGSQRVEFA